MRTDAALSPAMCSQWPGVCPGVRSTVLKCAPERTGESMSVTSETGAKRMKSPASPSGSAPPAAAEFEARLAAATAPRAACSDVACSQPAGSLSDGAKSSSFDPGPGSSGYSITLHQLTTASCGVAVVHASGAAT